MRIVYSNYGKNLKDYSIEFTFKSYIIGIGLKRIYKAYEDGNMQILLGK